MNGEAYPDTLSIATSPFIPEQQPAKHAAPKHGKHRYHNSLNTKTAKRTYHTRICTDLYAEQEKQKPNEKRYDTRHKRQAATAQQAANGYAAKHYQDDGKHQFEDFYLIVKRSPTFKLKLNGLSLYIVLTPLPLSK